MGPLVGGFMTAAVPLGALIGGQPCGPHYGDRFGRRRVLDVGRRAVRGRSIDRRRL